MELKREMFFDGENLKTNDVVQAIVSNPNYGVQILDFIGEIMRKDEEYHYEMKRLETKYHHDLKELKERYEVLDD